MPIRVLTWNLAWASSSSGKGREIVRRVKETQPDVAIFTEVTTPLIESLGGEAAYSGPDYGYDTNPIKRKVALWSPSPIVNVDSTGSLDLPPGRFVAADVHGVRTIGVCIPWRDAHVRTGRKNATIWEEHLCYVNALRCIVRPLVSNTILGGDFNQRHPRNRQPESVFKALSSALAHLSWFTSGPIGPVSEQSIDHVLTTSDFEGRYSGFISNEFGASTLSDHFGVLCEVNPIA